LIVRNKYSLTAEEEVDAEEEEEFTADKRDEKDKRGFFIRVNRFSSSEAGG